MITVTKRDDGEYEVTFPSHLYDVPQLFPTAQAVADFFDYIYPAGQTISWNIRSR